MTYVDYFRASQNIRAYGKTKSLRELVYERMARDCRSHFDPVWLKDYLDTCDSEYILMYADIYGVKY